MDLVYSGPIDVVEVPGVGEATRDVPVSIPEDLAVKLLQQDCWRPASLTVRIDLAPDPEAVPEPEREGVEIIALAPVAVGVGQPDGTTAWYSWPEVDSVVTVALADRDAVLAASPELREDTTTLKDRSKDELIEYAEARGLDTSGTKAELVERITAPPDPARFVTEELAPVEGDAEPIAFPEPPPVLLDDLDETPDDVEQDAPAGEAEVVTPDEG